MNNQNNLNNQTGNQQNNQQPINFGNNLSGNNDFYQNQQIPTNVSNQTFQQINNQQQSNLNIMNNQQNIGVNNQPIPEINNNVNNIPPQNINTFPEVKIPTMETQVDLVNQAPSNQEFNNYQQTNSNTNTFNNLNNANQQMINSANVQSVEKKGSKKILITILVIIGILISVPFIFTIILSTFYTTKTLDNTRKSAFISSANMYINGAKSLALSFGTDYYLSCDDDKIKYLSLGEINEVSDKSPFGNNFIIGEKYNKLLDTKPSDSYVRIEVNSSTCKYQYSIYITDGTYSIGSNDNPILESELDISDIK